MPLILAALFHPVNDITTNLDSPPRYVFIQTLHQDRPLTYPEAFKEKQRRLYPDLKPLELSKPADDVFATALRQAESQKGWKVVSVDADQRRIEAVATTALLKFSDDVVIEVKANTSGGSVVNMRSRSRVGRSDFAANYFRIRDFLKLL